MGDKNVNKPYDYSGNFSRYIADALRAKPVRKEDWEYLARAVKAMDVCKKLAEYVTEKLCAGEPLSDEIVCYIVLGVDKDQLVEAVSKEREKAQKKMAEEDYEKLKEALYKGKTVDEQGDKKDG